MGKNRVIYGLALFLVAPLWGLAFVFQKMGMESMRPFMFSGIRFLLGAAVLIPVIAWRVHKEGKTHPGLWTRLTWTRGALVGSVLFLGISLQQTGLVTADSGKAGFITGLYVVLVPILGLCWGQKTGPTVWIGAFLAVIGLYLLGGGSALNFAIGDSLILIGAFVWAAHVQLVGHYCSRLDPICLAFVQFATCSALSFTAGLVASEPLTFEGIGGACVALLYTGCMSSGVGFTMQVVAQQHVKPTPAGIIMSTEAVFAAIGGWLILHEHLPLSGCAVMLAGMALSQIEPRRRINV